MRESAVTWFGVLCVAALSGCSALIGVSDKQCNTDAECVKSELGDRCVAHVCVESSASCRGSACSAADGGTDAGDMPSGMCMSDDDCTKSGSPRCMNGDCVSDELASRWLCATEEAPLESGSVHYAFHVVEFVTRTAPKNITAKACRTNDVGCTDPEGTFSDTEGTGFVEFDLPIGFSGFFEVYSDATPALAYLTKPVTKDTIDRDLQVPSPSTVQLLAAIEGLVWESTKGMALIEAFDCTGTPAGGVQFTESKGSSTAFYIVDHQPNREAMVSVYDMLNNVADGGFINIQPGFVTFTANWGIDGPTLGSFNAHVRAGTVTFIDMYL
jgi:hypothetical protein